MSFSSDFRYVGLRLHVQTQITVMGAFLHSVSIGVASFNFSHDTFFSNFLVMMTWRGSVVSCNTAQNLLRMVIFFLPNLFCHFNYMGLAVFHYQSQHSVSIRKKKKIRFFPQFLFPHSLIYHHSNYFLPKGSKFLYRLLSRVLQVRNRYLIAPFRSPSLTGNFVGVCAHLWTLCSQFQTSSLTACSFLLWS